MTRVLSLGQQRVNRHQSLKFGTICLASHLLQYVCLYLWSQLQHQFDNSRDTNQSQTKIAEACDNFSVSAQHHVHSHSIHKTPLLAGDAHFQHASHALAHVHFP